MWPSSVNALTPLVTAALATQAGLVSAVSFSSSSSSSATDDKITPCTLISPNTGSFYDLRPISVLPVAEGKKPANDARLESWHARGWDYGSNFTLNICAPVMEEVKDVVGIREEMWRNVSAFYEKNGKTYSIGQAKSEPFFRGRKLVMNYTDGSPCDDYDDLDDDDDDRRRAVSRRKSTMISFHCEKEPLVAAAAASFVGTSPDECAYFFEVRSLAACGGAEPVQETLGPSGVFGIIVLIAVLVYFLGGIMYQRSVAHARGWRQLPNYSMWAGIGSFLKASLMSLVPGFVVRRGRTALRHARKAAGAAVVKEAEEDEDILPTAEKKPAVKMGHRLDASISRSSTSTYSP